MSFITDAAAIIFKQPFTQKLGKLDIDIVQSRNISEKSSLTNNPIEGTFNSDNLLDESTEISITAKISKFSLKNSKIKQISSLIQGKIPNRLKSAHDELYRIKEAREPIQLVMKFKTYNSMVMTSLEMPNEAGDGESFRFTATFKEARIVESQLVSLKNSRIKLDSAKKQSSYGRQTGTSKTFTPAQPKLTLGQFVKSLF